MLMNITGHFCKFDKTISLSVCPTLMAILFIEPYISAKMHDK